MTIKTKEQLNRAKEDLEDLRKAKKKILTGGQGYTVDSMSMTRANLKEINAEINELESAIGIYESSRTTRRKAKRVVPLE